MILKVN